MRHSPRTTSALFLNLANFEKNPTKKKDSPSIRLPRTTPFLVSWLRFSSLYDWDNQFLSWLYEQYLFALIPKDKFLVPF